MGEVKKIKQDKWVWMPHPAHLCVSDSCKFRLATYVGKYIVSTVGEYWPVRGVREIYAKVYDPEWHQKNNHLKGDEYDSVYFKRFGYEDIGGTGDKYETMVFEARKSGEKCCPWEIIVDKVMDEVRYSTAEEAMKDHYKLCREWSS